MPSEEDTDSWHRHGAPAVLLRRSLRIAHDDGRAASCCSYPVRSRQHSWRQSDFRLHHKCLPGVLSLLIVGAPLWYFPLALCPARLWSSSPLRARSILRKLYIYITLAVAGSILIYTAAVNRVELDISHGRLRRLRHSRVRCLGRRLGVPLAGRGARRAKPRLRSDCNPPPVHLHRVSGRAGYALAWRRARALLSYCWRATTPLLHQHLCSADDSGLWRHAMREMLAVANRGRGRHGRSTGCT